VDDALADWEDDEHLRAHAVRDGLLVTARSNGAMSCRRIDSGDLLWSKTHRPAPVGQSDPRFRSGNLLISLRNVDTLIILDGDTFEPVWSWGAGELELPHDPSWLPDGRLLVFDNGTRRGYSRVLEIDPRRGSSTWQYPKQGEHSLFSEWRGSSQRLAGGNTLICESERGHVLEVTPAGEIVWEFWNPELSDEGRKRIYRFKRLTPEEVGKLVDSASD
jgi:outer membrane protein assembly factor BamB